MKTIYSLSTLVLIALSLNSIADDKVKNNRKTNGVSVAPFSWGDPEEAAPTEVSEVKNLLVPIAPFIWGSPEETIGINKNNLIVPVAPFFFGDPETEAPEGLQHIKAKNAKVPVAPFVFGDPLTDIPSDLQILK